MILCLPSVYHLNVLSLCPSLMKEMFQFGENTNSEEEVIHQLDNQSPIKFCENRTLVIPEVQGSQ